MSSTKSGVVIVFGIGQVPYLNCVYGHGSFICDSYVAISRDGAFHFCTQPAAHGFNLTLDEVHRIAQEQGSQIEKQVRSYTATLRQETGIGVPSQEAL